MERADENLLPSVYKEVSEAFNAGPSDLGYLTFVRNFVQGLASPLAGVLVITYDRPIVLAIGTLCWALSTAAVGASNYFIQVNPLISVSKDSYKVFFNGSLKLYKYLFNGSLKLYKVLFNGYVMLGCFVESSEWVWISYCYTGASVVYCR